MNKIIPTIYTIANLTNLLQAYRLILNNSRSLKPCNNKITSKLNLKRLKKLGSILLTGQFKFYSNRRISPGQLETISIEDKLVQIAIVQVLECLFKKTFLKSTYTNKNEKTIINQFKSQKNIWTFRGKIKNKLESSNKVLLLAFIKKKIKCKKTVALIDDSLTKLFLKKAESTTHLNSKPIIKNPLYVFLLCLYLDRIDCYFKKFRQVLYFRSINNFLIVMKKK